MGVIITPESELGKELAKWEQHQTRLVPDGARPGNPYVYRPFPKMVYRAVKRDNGKVVCMAPAPQPTMFTNQNEYLVAVAAAESEQRACHTIVHSDDEWAIKRGQGWCETPADAIAQFEREEQERGNAAAEAAFAASRMTERAQRDFNDVQDLTHEHVPDVNKRTRKDLREKAADA